MVAILKPVDELKKSRVKGVDIKNRDTTSNLLTHVHFETLGIYVCHSWDTIDVNNFLTCIRKLYRFFLVLCLNLIYHFHVPLCI